MSVGVSMIANERTRQIVIKGYDNEHDDSQNHEELILAAIAYAITGIKFRNDLSPSNFWPWDWRIFKPKDKVQNLVRAGALIAAEIDRIERMDKENELVEWNKVNEWHEFNHSSDVPEISPIANDLPAVWDIVIGDMVKRDAMGTKKYGVRLQPFNGRNALWDAYQEALDLVVYLRQTIFEIDKQKINLERIRKEND